MTPSSPSLSLPAFEEHCRSSFAEGHAVEMCEWVGNAFQEKNIAKATRVMDLASHFQQLVPIRTHILAATVQALQDPLDPFAQDLLALILERLPDLKPRLWPSLGPTTLFSGIHKVLCEKHPQSLVQWLMSEQWVIHRVVRLDAHIIQALQSQDPRFKPLLDHVKSTLLPSEIDGVLWFEAASKMFNASSSPLPPLWQTLTTDQPLSWWKTLLDSPLHSNAKDLSVHLEDWRALCERQRLLLSVDMPSTSSKKWRL